MAWTGDLWQTSTWRIATVAGEAGGLDKAREVCADRTWKVGQLRAKGKRVVGYPCVYVPVEILTALGLVPYRTYGDVEEPVTLADRALPTSFCPIMRSCFDCALKAGPSSLDGLVVVHSCDPQEMTARLWESYVDYPYVHFIDMPGTVRPEALEYFKGQLRDLAGTLETFAAQRLTTQGLQEAVRLHNRQRGLVREIYEMTKPAPPLVSGTEILQVVKALMSLPVEEGNELVTQVIEDVKSRDDCPEEKLVRLMVWSSTIDDAEVMRVLESGANVVMDESCGGIRPYRTDVELTDDPVDGLARYYLDEITCARTFREASLGETSKDYDSDLDSRFGYLGRMVREWKVDGVVVLLVRYCDPFAFEVPSVRDYLDSIGIPSIYVEYDYARGTLASLRTRVEAFLETLGG